MKRFFYIIQSDRDTTDADLYIVRVGKTSAARWSSFLQLCFTLYSKVVLMPTTLKT